MGLPSSRMSRNMCSCVAIVSCVAFRVLCSVPVVAVRCPVPSGCPSFLTCWTRVVGPCFSCPWVCGYFLFRLGQMGVSLARVSCVRSWLSRCLVRWGSTQFWSLVQVLVAVISVRARPVLWLAYVLCIRFGCTYTMGTVSGCNTPWGSCR